MNITLMKNEHGETVAIDARFPTVAVSLCGRTVNEALDRLAVQYEDAAREIREMIRE